MDKWYLNALIAMIEDRFNKEKKLFSIVEELKLRQVLWNLVREFNQGMDPGYGDVPVGALFYLLSYFKRRIDIIPINASEQLTIENIKNIFVGSMLVAIKVGIDDPIYKISDFSSVATALKSSGNPFDSTIETENLKRRYKQATQRFEDLQLHNPSNFSDEYFHHRKEVENLKLQYKEAVKHLEDLKLNNSSSPSDEYLNYQKEVENLKRQYEEAVESSGKVHPLSLVEFLDTHEELRTLKQRLKSRYKIVIGEKYPEKKEPTADEILQIQYLKKLELEHIEALEYKFNLPAIDDFVAMLCKYCDAEGIQGIIEILILDDYLDAEEIIYAIVRENVLEIEYIKKLLLCLITKDNNVEEKKSNKIEGILCAMISANVIEEEEFLKQLHLLAAEKPYTRVVDLLEKEFHLDPLTNHGRTPFRP